VGEGREKGREGVRKEGEGGCEKRRGRKREKNGGRGEEEGKEGGHLTLSCSKEE
jgi:hypothetical protein